MRQRLEDLSNYIFFYIAFLTLIIIIENLKRLELYMDYIFFFIKLKIYDYYNY